MPAVAFHGISGASFVQLRRDVFCRLANNGEHPFDPRTFERMIFEVLGRREVFSKIFRYGKLRQGYDGGTPDLPASSIDHHFVPVN